MNGLNGKGEIKKSKTTSTIRSVPSDTPSLETSAMPHSTTEYLPPIPNSSSHITLTRHNSNSTGLSVASSLVRRISSEFTRSHSTPNNLSIQETPGGTNGITSSVSTSSISTNGFANGITNGLSTNGNHTSGSGSDHIRSPANERPGQNEIDTMRRELTSERLNTAEYKNQLVLAEAKLATQREEYDAQLHDAAVNKTLLKRRERQVAELKAQIDTEKQRAEKAVEREKGWRDQMEQLEQDTRRKVEEAEMKAAMFEGRSNTLTGHWKDQGADVQRSVKKMRKEIETIVEARRADDKKIIMLQGVCAQAAATAAKAEKEKEAIFREFEAYKRAQEQSLKDIKQKAQAQEEEFEAKVKASQETLDKLKWALNVKENVKDAQ
ncbi:uncharacterized protein PAC_04006 [Phialocephala subalpina]|uniref:SWI5-dependent HO expression protein 3 n=1 Tax=Phialocephala subalpina TaxID=576137 RepID=A0A1L7WMY5_9HELO|nr:uncharacterized protein PAC_04006 [Phialocephala subalpina]